VCLRLSLSVFFSRYSPFTTSNFFFSCVLTVTVSFFLPSHIFFFTCLVALPTSSLCASLAFPFFGVHTCERVAIEYPCGHRTDTRREREGEEQRGEGEGSPQETTTTHTHTKKKRADGSVSIYSFYFDLSPFTFPLCLSFLLRTSVVLPFCSSLCSGAPSFFYICVWPPLPSPPYFASCHIHIYMRVYNYVYKRMCRVLDFSFFFF
jgi:hypothetical protein